MIPDWLNLFFWARLPVLVGRLSPALGSVLTDGVYLARESFIGGGMPVIALGLGLLCGARHAGETFTASLLVMGVLSAVAMLSAHLGLWGSAGYVIGDLVIRDRSIPGSVELAALLLSYALLLLLLVYLPLLAGAVRLWVRRVDEVNGQPGMLWEVLAVAATAAVGAWAWTQALRVLILPTYTWQGLPLDASDTVPLAQRWSIVVAVAAIAAAFRVWREEVSRSDIVRTHVDQLRLSLARARPPRVAWPEPVSIGFGALLLTLLISGLLASVGQALAAIVFFALLLWGRLRLAEFVWPRGLSGIPTVVRGALALAVGYGLSVLLLPAAASSSAPAASRAALMASRAALKSAGSPASALPATPAATLTPALHSGSWWTLIAACVTAGLVALAVVRPRFAESARDRAS